MSLFFQISCLFCDFGFILSVLFDRYVSISLDFSIVKSTLDVFITDLFKSLLFVVSLLCESFCFTSVVFSSTVFRNRFLSCGLIIGVCITSLFVCYLTVCLLPHCLFEKWFINEFMILSLFPSCSLRNNICSSEWFINLSDVSLVEFP